MQGMGGRVGRQRKGNGGKTDPNTSKIGRNLISEALILFFKYRRGLFESFFGLLVGRIARGWRLVF